MNVITCIPALARLKACFAYCASIVRACCGYFVMPRLCEERADHALN